MDIQDRRPNILREICFFSSPFCLLLNSVIYRIWTLTFFAKHKDERVGVSFIHGHSTYTSLFFQDSFLPSSLARNGFSGLTWCPDLSAINSNSCNISSSMTDISIIIYYFHSFLWFPLFGFTWKCTDKGLNYEHMYSVILKGNEGGSLNIINKKHRIKSKECDDRTVIGWCWCMLMVTSLKCCWVPRQQVLHCILRRCVPSQSTRRK